MRRIDLLKPTFDEQTISELGDVLRSGWVMNGAKTKEFEEKFKEYVKADYAIATNSCTSALDLCIKAYNITGGELITTPFTFVSDAVVGEWNGMTVTFADIDPKTLCLDPKAIKITPETKVIIAVDSHGRLADIEGIRKVCKDAGREDILIIEDAAHAMYTPDVGKHADVTVWSFQAVKTMPIFDGGMITTNNEEIMKRVRSLYWVGVEKLTYERVSDTKYTWDYDIRQNGIKGYMTDVQAVLGIGQMRRLEETNQRRRDIAEKYNNAFKNRNWFKEPAYSHTVQYYTPNWYDRDGLSAYLAEQGIHTSVHFKPLSEMTYWKKAVKNPLPFTDMVWKSLLSLPVHNALTDEEQNYVIAKVIEYYVKVA
jgi:dTDP-4-amino-4,6-dideoxygalactose transaminase